MHNYMLTVWALECANGLHQSTAAIIPVTATFCIYMAREEAERTVVAVMATTRQSSNKLLAVTALEALLRSEALSAITLLALASSHQFHLSIIYIGYTFAIHSPANLCLSISYLATGARHCHDGPRLVGAR